MSFVSDKKQSIDFKDIQDKNILEILEDKNFLPNFISLGCLHNMQKLREEIEILETFKRNIFIEYNIETKKEEYSPYKQAILTCVPIEEYLKIKNLLPQLVLVQLLLFQLSQQNQKKQYAYRNAYDAFNTIQLIQNKIKKLGNPSSSAILMMIKLEPFVEESQQDSQQQEKASQIKELVLEQIDKLDEELKSEFRKLEALDSKQLSQQFFDQNNLNRSLELAIRSEKLIEKMENKIANNFNTCQRLNQMENQIVMLFEDQQTKSDQDLIILFEATTVLIQVKQLVSENNQDLLRILESLISDFRNNRMLNEEQLVGIQEFFNRFKKQI
ncbi:hypothetical protein ABPG72_020942 [Tetrahymena utriculariae]